MKLFPVLSLLLALGCGRGQAQALREAENLLQAREYAAAAGKLETVPAAERTDGYVPWLQAVALQGAGQAAQAAAACDAVPAGAKWHRKARLLKGRLLTDLKKHAEAETIYAEEAAQALAPARKDELAGLLVAFADEIARKPAAGEIDAPAPDLTRAVKLYQEALGVDFLTPDFLDETLFRLAAAFQELGQHQNALLVLNDYLVQFDRVWEPIFRKDAQDYRAPEEAGAQGAPGPAREKPRDAKRFLQPGKHAAEARLRVAQSQLLLARPEAARATAERLLAMQPLPEPGLVEQAAWLRCGSYAGEAALQGGYTLYGAGSGQPAAADNAPVQEQQAQQQRLTLTADPVRHTEALRAFLSAHPASRHAPEAARLIAENLLSQGRTDEGIAALQAFIEVKGYQFDPAAEANRKPDAATGQTPAEALEQQKQAAFFRIAQIESDRKSYDKAIAKWRDYTVNYPNGAQWAAAQKGMIDAEFQLGIAAVAAGDEKLARGRFDAFLTKYPLDDRARQILFIYGQFHYAAAQVAELAATEAGKLKPQAVDDHFNAAMGEWARLIAKYPQTEEASLALYNTALILTDKMGRMEEGLAAFRRLTWGQWAAAAKERVGILEEKSLAISAPKVFRTNEAPHLAVSVRNIRKLKVSRYPLNLEGWLRSVHRLGGLEKLDVDLIAPEKTWEVDVADYRPYASRQQQIAIPFPDNNGGASVVRVEGEDWQATTLVVRSDIELMTQATRGEVLVFALNARENKPAADAPVLISDGTKIIAEGKTGADGVFRHRAGSGDKLPDTVRAFVLSTNDSMVSGLDLSALTQVQQPKTTTHTTFDRPHYFPGQTAQFVIVRHEVEGAALKGQTGSGTLRILAPDDRLVMAKPVTWADGTIRDRFTIPGTAPAGEYKVQVLDGEEKIIVRGPFNVAETPQENTPQLTLKLERTAVRPGDKVAATLFADWPWGLPVSDEEAEITFPDGRTERLKTDAAGVLSFDFAVTSGTDGWVRRENVTVRFPQQPGQTAVHGSVSVFTDEWSLGLENIPEVIPAGTDMEVKVRTRSHDGTPVAKEVKAALYRRTAPPPSRVLEGVPWISYTPPAVAEEKVEEFTLTTDAATGRAGKTLRTPAGGHYVLRCAGPDGMLQDQRQFYVAGEPDPHGLRLHAPGNSVDEGSTLTLKLQSLKPYAHVLVTVSAEQFISHQILAVAPGLTTLPLQISAEHGPNFRVTATAIDGTNLRAASMAFAVRSGLKIRMTPPANAGEAPGYEVTDLSGQLVPASTLTAVVQTSADPDAIAVVEGFSSRALSSTQLPRDLRLAVHTSAALMFPGTSLKINPATGAAAETKVAAGNDQERLIRVQNLELSFNSGNSLLLMNNGSFASMNCFVQLDAPQVRGQASGPLLFAEGVRRASDHYIQSTLLPPVPDAANASASYQFEEAGVVLPAGPRAVIFRSHSREPLQLNIGTGPAWDGNTNQALQVIRSFPYPTDFDPPQQVQSFGNAPPETSAAVAGTSDSPGDAISWTEGKFDLSRITDGRWNAVVRAWTPQHGMVEASLPFVIRRPLAVEVLRGRKGILILTNRDGMKEAVTAKAQGYVQGEQSIQLNGAKRQIAVMEPDERGTLQMMSHLSVERGGQLLGVWHPAERATLHESMPAGGTQVITAGGVFRAAGELRLDAPPGQQMPGAFGRIFQTPGSLVAWLGEDGDGFSPTASQPAVELMSRLVWIERLRRGSDEQKKKADSLLPACVDLVSEIVLQEQDGGWAWGGLAINPDILTTAQTWWTLHMAKQAGVPVSDKLKARVERFIDANYAGIPADDYEKKAAVLHSLAACGRADYAAAAPLLRLRERLSDTATAFLCAALIRMDRVDEAQLLLSLLEQRAERSEAGPGLATAAWKGSDRIVRLSERELATSVTLWCYARLQPASATGAAAANWLLGSRALAPRGGSHSVGTVALALDAWFSGANDWSEPGFATFEDAGGPAHQPEETPWANLQTAEGGTKIRVLPRNANPVIVTVSAAASAKEAVDPKPWTHPEIASRKYLHTALLHGDAPLNAASTSPVSVAELGQRVRVEVRLKSTSQDVATHPQYLVWDEPLPDCFQLVPGTLAGNFNKVELLPGRIRLTYAPGVVQHLSYEIVALVPGESTIAPSVISDAYDPAKFRPGTAAVLKVLPPGEKSPDAYAMNQAEHFELAKRTFDGGQSEECLKHLEALAPSARRADFEKDLARMKLWLLTDKPDGDAAQIVSAFETLNERHPSLVIPFDRILRVGAAYQKIGEHERGAYVFSAALDANFLTDSSISAALEDNGDFAGSVAFQERLWQDAPDTEDPRAALFALSQTLFRKAAEAEKISVRHGQPKLEKNALLARSRDLLTRYITLYPADEQADDAAFSLTNAFFALRDYPGVVTAAEAAAQRHPGSSFLGQFQYMAALGHFWQFHYDAALAAAAPVANGSTKDRDLARYITGQIHHAGGRPDAAVEWYRRVKEKYADAADALAAFEEKKIGVPEIASWKPGEEVKLAVTHRNMKSVSLQIYKVDLMKLYLREKNLSRVTRVNLAGIAPEAAVPLDVSAAAPWTDHTSDVALPLKEEGAYLVIARGDDLFTSGLVLISALKLDVREEARRGSVRVNVISAADGKYVADAEVKAIASGSTEIQSGQTDPRGIFESTGLRGTATVIVRQGENRYAFHRGTMTLGETLPVTPAASAERNRQSDAQEFDPPQIPQSFGGKVLSKDAYLENLSGDNRDIQDANWNAWDFKRRSSGKGVQADKALKK